MKHAVSGSGLVQEFKRRKIEPDQVAQVTQGTLRLWQYCGSRIVELCIGNIDGELKPGMALIWDGAFENTYTPQEIADYLTKGKEADIALIGGNVNLACLKCSHTWRPIKDKRPAVCPKCKSYSWDKFHTRTDKLKKKEGDE